jgi:hypothetical protein
MRMRTSSAVLLLVIVSTLSTVSATAQDDRGPQSAVVVTTPEEDAAGLLAASLAPPVNTSFARVLGTLPPPAARVLNIGYAQARQRIATPACEALFTALGVDARTILAQALYSAPQFTSEVRICERRRATAFTVVGRGRTIICPAFAALKPGQAAVVLVHEALHNAGQAEWPVDLLAPTAQQIDQRVRTSCRL